MGAYIHANDRIRRWGKFGAIGGAHLGPIVRLYPVCDARYRSGASLGGRSFSLDCCGPGRSRGLPGTKRSNGPVWSLPHPEEGPLWNTRLLSSWISSCWLCMEPHRNRGMQGKLFKEQAAAYTVHGDEKSTRNRRDEGECRPTSVRLVATGILMWM